MSKFSGKYDFKDAIDSRGAEHVLHSKIYMGDEIIPMKFETPKDLIPYYPYLVAIQASDEDGGIIRLTKESWVDTEERKTLTLYLERLKRKWRSCKRKKQEFNYTKYYTCSSFADTVMKEMESRIKADGEKATIEGIHTWMAEYYRNKLYEEMVAAGYEPYKAYSWVYKRYDEQYNKLFAEYYEEKHNEE